MTLDVDEVTEIPTGEAQGQRESAASVFEHLAEQHKEHASQHEEKAKCYAALADFIDHEVPSGSPLENDLWELAQKHMDESI